MESRKSLSSENWHTTCVMLTAQSVSKTYCVNTKLSILVVHL